MSLWADFAPLLAKGESLTYDQSREMMALIMAGELDEVKLSSYLSIMAVRGINVRELRGLADQMQASAKHIDLPGQVVDIVGTGGDKANTVNISTMAALVIAATGLPVVKHGNRASTSACGSADLLEALGVDLNLPSSQIIASFDVAGIAFLFANKFHPSMRHAARVRRDLGFPTAFNVLGPLTNPVQPVASVVGVAREDAAPLVAGVFAERGTSAFVFRGAKYGLDELTAAEPSLLWAIHGGRMVHMEIDPAGILGLDACTVEDLRGSTADVNSRVARQVFEGADGPVADAVAMNAALGIMAGQAAGLASSSPLTSQTNWLENTVFEDGFREAFKLAKQALSSGATQAKLETWVRATQEQ